MRIVMISVFLVLSHLPAVTHAAAEDGAVRLYPGEVSTGKSELNFQLIDTEREAVFTRAEADYSHGKIYHVTIDAGDITDLETIGFSDSRYKDSDPWLSPSGKDLYFISNRPAFFGDTRNDDRDYDIWRSRKAGENWLAPEHLGSVNTLSGEFGPEINGGFLYFSSRKNGRLDIYRAKRDAAGFGNPMPLPSPINTEYQDSDFTLTTDGRVALWWSTRPGGRGSGDLYTARLTDDGWSDPENLGPTVNTANLDFTPSLSPNNAVLYFASNTSVPDQDDGAADLYRIDTKQVPALRAALAETAREKLKVAFGGETALSNIQSIAFALETRSPASGTRTRRYDLDFSIGAIAMTDQDNAETRYADSEGGTIAAQGETRELPKQDRKALLQSLTSNFLYYLSSSDLDLIGPEDIQGHGNLNWFRMRARGHASPLVGLDPMTGRIVKVLGDTGYSVLELDYLENDTGLIWPYRFMVHQNRELILEGRFFDLTVNGPRPE